MMRLAYGQIKTVDRETMMNARQMGIDRVQFNLPYDLPADKYWKYEDLANFKGRCDQYGVIVEAMENLPISFYDKAMLGLPGRDEQIDNVCESIRNLGRVGIPVLGYHFSPSFVCKHLLILTVLPQAGVLRKNRHTSFQSFLRKDTSSVPRLWKPLLPLPPQKPPCPLPLYRTDYNPELFLPQIRFQSSLLYNSWYSQNPTIPLLNSHRSCH